MHSAKYFSLRTFEDTQHGVIRALASFGRPAASSGCARTLPWPCLRPAPMSHSTQSSGVRPQVRSLLQVFGEPCLSMPLPRRRGSGQEPARRMSRDVVEKFCFHSLQALSLARDKTTAFVLLMFCQQLCGRVLWAGDTWLWSMRGQLMAPRARTEIASTEISLPPHGPRAKLPIAEPPAPVHPFSSLAARSLNFPQSPKNAFSPQVCPACCTHPVASVLQDFYLLQASNLHRCPLSQPTAASRSPLALRALAKSCCIFSAVCLSLAGKCKHQAPKHQPSL